MSASESIPTHISARERLAGLWVMTHPGPSLVTALAYAIFALLAAQGRPNPVVLAVTVVGLIGQQFAISTLNDYCDREADAHSHKNKPIARGVLPPWVALVATALCAALMVACFAPYGLTPLLIAGAFLALGFAYDLGVKSTAFGGVMMGLAFPLLPLLAWDLFATIKPALFWTFPLGLALGLAIHLADALPDAAVDGAAGARGLTQTLGRHALTACWSLLAAANALVIVLALTRLTPTRPIVLAIAAPLAFATLATDIAIARQPERSERQRLSANFILTIIIALIIALGWLASAIL